MSRRKPNRPRRRKRPPPADIEHGIALHLKGKLAEAEGVYQRLIDIDEGNARAYHLLGRVLHERGDAAAAIAHLTSAASKSPRDIRILQDLGLLYKDIQDWDQAASCFARVLDLDAEHIPAINNLGIALKRIGRLEEAAEMFRRAVALQEDDAAAHCNLGNTLRELGQLQAAEQAYRRALQLNPSMLDVYSSLAAVLRRMNRSADAQEVFRAWLKQEPENPIALHMVAAGESGDIPARANEAYVREVFDEFANTFDAHLTRLEYQGPNLIAAALTEHFPSTQQGLTVLDAGCGTGLCAEVLQPYSRELIGVDLSEKMVEKARELNCYDQLAVEDLAAFLSRQVAAYDLVCCADTFGYFGDLRGVLQSVSSALRPKGVLICTFEIDDALNEELGYTLLQTGRYRHSREYLLKVLSESRFDILRCVDSTLRTEAGVPQPCAVVTARAGPSGA